jgi:hypothetical protein
MIRFEAILQQFASNGEKTGWTYIEISAAQAKKLKPDNKRSFRVKGKLDSYSYANIGLLPMGEGDFIMAINATIRKAIKKSRGAKVKVQMELDLSEKPLSTDLMECLGDEPKAIKKFNSLPPSHQKYFSNWIESAKTDSTKTKRITQSVIALAQGFGYSEMIRRNKDRK